MQHLTGKRRQAGGQTWLSHVLQIPLEVYAKYRTGTLLIKIGAQKPSRWSILVCRCLQSRTESCSWVFLCFLALFPTLTASSMIYFPCQCEMKRKHFNGDQGTEFTKDTSDTAVCTMLLFTQNSGILFIWVLSIDFSAIATFSLIDFLQC